jgi:uncharacterized membrane protein
MVVWIILLYASFAFVDILDKFLLTRRKIKPLSYTFYTVVTGALLLLIWPFVYEVLPTRSIFLNLLSGAYFSAALYVFFKTLSFGEVSRVVPFIFGLVPGFDVLLSAIFGVSPILPKQFAALALLIPGAMLIAYFPSKFFSRHLGWKILAAFLFSSYNLLWHYGAQIGSSLNNLMWNRLSAAAVLVLLLIVPAIRKTIFTVSHVPKKKHTSILFLIKQAVGGLNFILLSHLYTVGTVAVIDALAGFRYSFVFLFSLFLGSKYKKILAEDVNRKIVLQKALGIAAIFIGTLILLL